MSRDQIGAVITLIHDAIAGTPWMGKVFVAGGAARDYFLEYPSSSDLDLLVVERHGGVDFATWLHTVLSQYSAHVPVIFERFGTAKMNILGVDVELVEPRGETYRAGDRNPDTTFGVTLREDSMRRDFTINSILINISTGEVVDYHNGVKDIWGHSIRTAMDPEVIFRDDPLRMLRAVRFAEKLNFQIHDTLWQAMDEHHALINTVSQERINDELWKMLSGKEPDRAVDLLMDSWLAGHVLAPIAALRGVTQNKYHVHDVYDHTMQVLYRVPATLPHRLSALFHDVGKPVTRTEVEGKVQFPQHDKIGGQIAATYLYACKYPSALVDCVVTVTENHMRLKSSGPLGESISDKALRKFALDCAPHLDVLLDVMHADNCSHAPEYCMPEQIPAIRQRLEGLARVAPTTHVTLPINGNDVMKHFNIKPCKFVGELLGVVKEAWLENPELTKAQALTVAGEYFDKHEHMM